MVTSRAWNLVAVALVGLIPSICQAMTTSEFESLLSHSENVAELTEKLPPEFRKNFTLVYRSRSPFKESISPEFPRVILFNRRADFIITFIGDPNAQGHDIVETLSFDDRKKAFQLKAYQIQPKKKPVALNTQSCIQCHGTDTRPIFDSYPLWPGFYGSLRDSFLPQSLEQQFYRDFLEKRSRTGVYGKLDWSQADDTSTPPYLDPKFLSLKEVKARVADLPLLPNTRLGMALTELNRKRIFRKISSSKTYTQKAHTILRTLLGCEGQDTQIGTQAKDAIQVKLRAENIERIKRMEVDTSLYPPRTFDMLEFEFTDALIQFDWLVRELKIDRKDWSMALEANSNSFYDGIFGGSLGDQDFSLKEDLLFEMLSALTRKTEKAQNWFEPYTAFPALRTPYGNRLDLSRAKRYCDGTPSQKPNHPRKRVEK